MKTILALILVLTINICGVYAQCNPNISSCSAGTSPSYSFVNTQGPGVTYANPVGCNTGISTLTNEYAFITLYITGTGNLNLLVDGNSSIGFLDVVIYNIPPGQAPCQAVMNSNNEIACNYASNSSGCVQIGNAFPCTSTISTVPVTAGQVLMVIVNNYSGTSSSFNLTMSSSAGSASAGPPNATISNINISGLPPNTICKENAPIQLNAFNNGGTWTGNGVSASGLFDPAAAGVGTHVITYSIGVNPCMSTDSKTITVLANPTIAVNSQSICIGQSATLTTTVNPSGGSFSWTNGATLSSTNTAIVSANPTTTTVYTVSYTAPNGCAHTATSQVYTGPQPIPINTIATVCNNDAINLTAPAGNTYNWLGPNSFTSNIQNPIITNADVVNNGIYSVTITNSGCTYQGTVSITVNNALSFTSVSTSTTLCIGKNLNLSCNVAGGSGNYSYSWAPTTGLSSSSQASTTCSATTSQNYTLSVSDVNCSVTTPLKAFPSVGVVPLPSITFTASTTQGCEPLCVSLTENSVPPSNSCHWRFNNGLSIDGCNPQSVCFLLAGTYNASLTVIDINGCIDSVNSNAYIHVDPSPIADFDFSPINPSIFESVVNFYDNSTGFSSPIVEWLWNFDDRYSLPTDNVSNDINPSHDYTKEGKYNVSLLVTNSFGCTDEITKGINVSNDLILFIPNTFTPSKQDGLNDSWCVQGSGFLPESFNLSIYDRWGNIIFKTTDYTNCWDGKIKGGMDAGQGIYTYKILLKDYKNHSKELIGHINLL